MSDTPVDHGAYYLDEGSPIMGEPIMDDEPIMDYEPVDQGWPIMDDRQADHGVNKNDDHVSNNTSDRVMNHMIMIDMADGYQHKIENVATEQLDMIMRWLSDYPESIACKIEIQRDDSVNEFIVVMRAKIVSIRVYSLPMGGEDTP